MILSVAIFYEIIMKIATFKINTYIIDYYKERSRYFRDANKENLSVIWTGLEKETQQMITKQEFIEKKSKSAYRSLIDFLQLEVTEDSFNWIYEFLSVENFRKGEYEGTQYILKKLNREELVIIDTVAEEFSSDISTTYFQLTVLEMLYIMDEIEEWRKDF